MVPLLGPADEYEDDDNDDDARDRSIKLARVESALLYDPSILCLVSVIN